MITIDYVWRCRKVGGADHMWWFMDSPANMVIAKILAAFCLLLLSNEGKGHSSGADQQLPNIVFMMADDLGYGDVGYNGGNATTPNLDAMASGANTIHLTRYYSGGPVCSPTRGTVLTGRNHNRYCVWSANTGSNKDDFVVPERMPLPTSEITVADILKKHGYQTAMFGKWHLGDFKVLPEGNKKWPVSHPGMHGFDEWWGTERSAQSANLNCACFNDSEKLCVMGHYTNLPPCFNYYTVSDNGTLKGMDQPLFGDDTHFIVSLFEEYLKKATATGKPSLSLSTFPFTLCTSAISQQKATSGTIQRRATANSRLTTMEQSQQWTMQ